LQTNCPTLPIGGDVMKTKFYKTIYVVWEKPENGKPFMVVYQNPVEAAEIFNDVAVGVYKLERIGKVKTTSELV